MFVRIRVRISGRVQGVGYRAATLNKARQLGLVGWVKNCPTGEVEALTEGGAEIIQEFVTWCQIGPSAAEVSAVQVLERTDCPSKSFQSFEITR